MAPVDPGSQIYWSKNPSYTTSLLSSISLLPSPDSRQLLFSSSKSKSTQWKNTKQSTLETVTSRVFSANGDQQRERKQRDSTMRRITQLGKEYNDSLGQLKQDPYNVNKTLDDLRRSYPYWDQLRALLKDHPEMSTWDEDEDQIRDDMIRQDQEEQEMQDVHYHHQPIAGPSNHRQQPQPPPVAAPPAQPVAPRNQYALANGAHDPFRARQPSPVRFPPPPQQAQPPPPTPWTADLLQRRQQLERDFAAHSSSSPRRRSRSPEADSEGSVQAWRRGWEAQHSGARERREGMERLEGIRERAEQAAVRRQREDREFEQQEREVRDAGEHVRREFERYGERAEGRRSASPQRQRENRPIQAPRQVEQAPVPPAQVEQPPIVNNPPPPPAQPEPQQEDVLDSCPKCSLPFHSLSLSASEAHMRQCFDDGGAHIESCPVCDTSLVGGEWSREKAEKHVDDCCRALEAGGSGGGGGDKGSRRGRREHVVFQCDSKSVPRDSKTSEPLECSFCLDDFESGTQLARLSCYCIYHEECIREYWDQPGDKFCPLHRDLDGISEVVMQ